MTEVTATDHWVDTQRGRLFARRWQTQFADLSKPTIVLFHDSLGCVQLWKDFPVRLATSTGHAVVAYDRLGFGQSDAYPGTLDSCFVRLEAAEHVPLLLQAVGAHCFIAFGHSVGGGMAVATAATLPDRCVSVITESAQAFVEDVTLEGIRAAKLAFEQPGQFERLRRHHGEKAQWVLDAWIETWLSPAFADWSLEAYLRDVRCPILAMHGDMDEYGSLAHPRLIARLAGGPAEVSVLEGNGHVPHRESPELVLSEVARFLSRVEFAD